METVKKYHCPYCGTYNDLNQSHCSSCGHDLGLYAKVVVGYYDHNGQFVIGKPRKPNGGEDPTPPPPPKPFPWKKLVIFLSALIVVAAAVFLLRSCQGPEPDIAETTAGEMAPQEGAVQETMAPETRAAAGEAVLPDFQAFTNGAVQLQETKEYDFAWRYVYTVPATDLQEVFDQYRSLLEGSYPYEQTGTVQTTEDGWVKTNYAYRYTGTAEVGIMNYEDLGFENICIRLGYFVHQESGNVAVYLDVVKDIQYADTGERATAAGNPVAGAQDTVLPDFLAFADGSVTLKETVSYDAADRYVYTATGMDLMGIFDDYSNLLEYSYPYDRTVKMETESNGWKNTYYAYSYNGSADVDTMRYSDLGIEHCSVRIVYCHHQESGVVEIHVDLVKDIQYVDKGDRTTVEPASQKKTVDAVIPDFQAFANGAAEYQELEQMDNRYCYVYSMSDAELMEQYRALLTEQYAYEQMGTSTSSEEWDYTYYWYRYTGPAEVSEMTVGIKPSGTNMEDCNAWIVYCYHQQSGTGKFYVCAANEITYSDNGDRAAGNSQ